MMTKRSTWGTGLTLLAVLVVGLGNAWGQARDVGQAYVTPSVLAALRRPAAKGQVATRVEVIVTFRAETGLKDEAAAADVAQRRDALLDALKTLPSTSFSVTRSFVRLPGMAMEVDLAALDALRRHPDVVAINENAPLRPFLTQANPLTGADDAQALGFTGKNVRALVIDSGISLNAGVMTVLGNDLLGHRCFRKANDCPNNGDDSATTLQFSHGTHVAGVLTGPNGVAPDAKFFAAKVLDSNLDSQPGQDGVDNVLAALDFALDDPDGFGFDLINMSLGAGTDGTSRAQCDQDNALLVAAAAQLNAQRITLFAAAGNGGRINLVGSPACVSGVIAVGASLDAPNNGDDIAFNGGPGCVDSRDGSPSAPNVADRVACFSDTHPSQGADRLIDLYAPGSQITSVGKDGSAFTAEGTSFSTPYAAGVAALMIEAAAEQGQNLTPAQIETQLRSTGVPIADFRNALIAAVPRVNALAAVEAAGAPENATIFRSGFEAGETAPPPLARFTFAMSASVANTNANGSVGDAGDTIAFTFSFTNSGEAALSGIAVTATLLPTLNCTLASLAVGATGSCTPSNNVYTITAADVSAGTVQAAATATATAVGAPAPNPVSDTDAISVSAPPPVIGQGKSGLGTNLESVEDFSVAYPFADFFKQSRPWFPGNQNGFIPGGATSTQQAALDARLDADGWVQSLPACNGDPQVFCSALTVFNASGSPYPSGNYVVLFEGQGVIRYSGAVRNDALSAPGRDVISVPAATPGQVQWTLIIESTAAAPNHLRNIRVLPPGIPETNTPTFHPDFLAKLAPYRAVRFMDWMRTNGGGFGGAPNPQVEFTDRSLPTDAHWTREAGVPLEVMVELSNLLDVEPWFTLPHLTSDAYVRAFATMVRDRYESGRVIYVEHSNEVWNNFPQGCGGFDCNNPGVGSLQQRGDTLFGSTASPFERRLNAHGLRTRQICDIFRSVFGARAAWIECSFGAQAANPFVATETVDCPLAVGAGMVQGACANPGDAIAIAPYFSTYVGETPNQNEVALWTLNQLFAEIQDGGQLADVGVNAVTPCTFTFPQDTTPPCDFSSQEEAVRFTASHRSPAQQRQLALISYEGGQHLAGVGSVADDQAITNLFVAANLDPRMGTAYTQYLTGWKDNGGEVFMHFNLSFRYGRFGSWGAMQSLTEAPNPKQQAIGNFVANNPCWWPGCGGSTPPPPPPPPPPPACNGELLLDGGLEATDFANPSAPVNAAWGSTSTNFGSVLCRSGVCPDDVGTALQRSGEVWAWFGGIDAAETATLRQSVTIPAGTNVLSFFLRRGFISIPLDAALRLRVDGVEVTAFLEPGTAEAAYVQQTVDLSAFGDGQTHQIELQYVNPAGSGKSNFVVDDLSLTCTP